MFTCTWNCFHSHLIRSPNKLCAITRVDEVWLCGRLVVVLCLQTNQHCTEKIHDFRDSDAIWRQRSGSSLDQIMTSNKGKPLHEPRLVYCQLNP